MHWIGEDNSRERPGWLPPDLNPLKLVMRTDDVQATPDLLNPGIGVGRLPSFLARQEKNLQQLKFAQPIPRAPVWMLTHADMRRVNRISAFTSFVAEAFRERLA